MWRRAGTYAVMDKLAPKCHLAQAAYEKCFSAWYSGKFLKGDVSSDCQDEFETYKECVMLAVETRQERGAQPKKQGGKADAPAKGAAQ